MKYRDEIHLKLKNEIVNFKNTYIPLRTLLIAAESVSDDMPAFLQSNPQTAKPSDNKSLIWGINVNRSTNSVQ